MDKLITSGTTVSTTNLGGVNIFDDILIKKITINRKQINTIQSIIIFNKRTFYKCDLIILSNNIGVIVGMDLIPPEPDGIFTNVFNLTFM